MTQLATDIIGTEDLSASCRKLENGNSEAMLVLPTIHCGGCVSRIEKGISRIEGVKSVRVNLTSKRMTVQWAGDHPPGILDALRSMGHTPQLLGQEEQGKDKVLSMLISALAVSGFGASNIMILSVAVWSGVEDQTRTLFHWLSALIALPVVIYSGRVFFASAYRALRRFETNMDVPISLGITLACILSIYDTLHDGKYAYFDAAVSLIFFLLIGRTLDHLMRAKASTAVSNLARLVGHTATVEEDGSFRTILVNDIRKDMILLIAAGQRVPVDSVVIDGQSDVDASLVSGESLPLTVCAGGELRSGYLNLSAPLHVRATSGTGDSFLAEMMSLMEGANAKKSRYQRLADRASRIYTPAAHIAAFMTFAGWMIASGDFHAAATAAITVLIITCPCALGLAVPMVQVIASRNLFGTGIVVKNGEALERLREADTVIFDKTGTLTLSEPQLSHPENYVTEHLSIARQMAAFSRHPYCRALVAGVADIKRLDSVFIREVPGQGMELSLSGDTYRLGKTDWALGTAQGNVNPRSSCTLSINGALLDEFYFKDSLRLDAFQTVARLKERGYKVEVLSGDKTEPVAMLCRELGISSFSGAVTPQAKLVRLNDLAATSHKVIMIGDGLNDLPALAGSHVSFAPSGANDVSQKAADFILLDGKLGGILHAIDVAKLSNNYVLQNFTLAATYNIIALPLAMAGLVTPLLAALAMSASSIMVVANALRLSRALRKYGAT
ncbi:MAG: heavy metal translocating P-type ATPase [bacterium]|nr:heavy metal translocating P-type ATPase [bacterium]